jgi:hypothetical protein
MAERDGCSPVVFVRWMKSIGGASNHDLPGMLDWATCVLQAATTGQLSRMRSFSEEEIILAQTKSDVCRLGGCIPFSNRESWMGILPAKLGHDCSSFHMVMHAMRINLVHGCELLSRL